MSREALRKCGQEMAARLGQGAARSAVPGMDDVLAEVVYGGVWDRPHLGLPDRALCSLVVLSVLQRLLSLKAMVATALDAGLAPRSILEVFVQVGLYAGFVTTEESASLAQEGFVGRGITIPDD